ncbi:MAG: hypothetical protein KC589_03845 [Nanoarchaeota archaeon]|nr:hypothetical protein [Nanoarchaeota archaeon]
MGIYELLVPNQKKIRYTIVSMPIVFYFMYCIGVKCNLLTLGESCAISIGSLCSFPTIESGIFWLFISSVLISVVFYISIGFDDYDNYKSYDKFFDE